MPQEFEPGYCQQCYVHKQLVDKETGICGNENYNTNPTQAQELLGGKKGIVAQLRTELAIERESTQQALQTSREWHERQKAEIIDQWKDKVFQLKTKLTNFLNSRKQINQAEITLIKEVLRE